MPAEFDIVREIYLTKFDEIFGGKPIKGRAFTFGQTRHAKNVVRSDEELFINLGEKNPDLFKLMRHDRGYRKQDFPIPLNAGFGAMIVLGYYIIGNIQRVNPQWFKESVLEYCGHISESFGQNIDPIVK
ncbi:MAG: hypothetical protein Q8N99_01110 [Nanoarchaeota archaeon]|nr:hypothetical protein [Nanoarchaeota archaeon]